MSMTFFALAPSPLEVLLPQWARRQLDPRETMAVLVPLLLLVVAVKAAVLLPLLLPAMAVKAAVLLPLPLVAVARPEMAKTPTSDLEPFKTPVSQTVLPETSLLLLRFLASLESLGWLSSCRHVLSMDTPRG